MLNASDYAIFAANAYAASDKVVTEVNEIKTPSTSGWDVLLPAEMLQNTGINDATGFLARAYRKGNEIVISYGGTTPENGLDWTNGNLPAALGYKLAPQVLDAARFYLDVVKANPGATVTFTGHSLGGGLASLMAVYFNKSAQTFDQAPFGKTAASASIYNELKSKLELDYSLPADFLSYSPATGLDARKSNVTETYLKGEALQYLTNGAAAVALTVLGGGAGLALGILNQPYGIKGNGGGNPVDAGSAGVSPVDLHSMVLLASTLRSENFRQASVANPELLQQLFRSSLYTENTQDKAVHNLLNLLLQQQVSGNAALDALATDLGKFRGVLDPVASGYVNADDKLKNALYGLALDLYYIEAQKRIGMSDPLTNTVFKTVDGGVQFAPDASKADTYKDHLNTLLFELGQYLPVVQDYLKPLFDRYAIGTGGAMTVAPNGDDKKDLMLGGTQGDTLSGGGGNDTLLGMGGDDTLDGGAGEDTLYGGTGNDTLRGGEGNDIYVINTGDGPDTIVDEGANRILYNGKIFAGLAIKDQSTGQYKFVDADDKTKTLEFHSPGVLSLDGTTQITFQNQTSAEALDGSFGIQLYEETATSTQFDRTIVGDLVVSNTQKDDLGNYVPTGGASPGRNDGFFDSAGNDLIQGLAGNDNIYSWRGGDDQIEGGDGSDFLVGGMGKDIVIGGAGRDVLVEGGDDDKLYADNVMTLEEAIAAQNAAPSGLQGEALSGSSGDDLAIGGTGNDVLFGGTGDDILVAGAGDDDIDGDAMADNIMRNWSTQRSATSTVSGTSYNILYNQFNMDWPTEGGDDVIYAGAGEDWVLGGYGNDHIDGGNDADKLWGEGGHDDVFGGVGNDLIMGDNARLSIADHGDDYLDGEDGDDTLYGEGGSDMLFGGTGNDELYADNSDGSGAGNDTLDGEAGNDVLLGGALDDELFGGEGSDFLQGDSGTGSGDGHDMLDGGAGDDILLGEGGRDELHGGDGADQIAGDNGGYDTSGDADTIYGGAGDDLIDGQGGNDVIDAGADNDLVAGGLGNDLILGGLGDDQLQGGDGDDTLEGGEGSDVLFGEAGNDTLRGGAGTDYLFGGAGDDILDGGDGDDVYYYGSGEGSDHIADSGGTDWMVFTDITWGQITLGTGSLKLSLPDGSELHLDDFDPDNPYAAGGIEYFQFADGVVMTKAQLINTLGIQPTGTPEADMLTGTALSETIQALTGDDVVTARGGNDTVYAADGADIVYGGDGNDIVYGGNGDDVLLGEAGNDTLHGEAGNDLLSGGAGTDTLQGGDGDDVYLFQAGDGQDTATDTLGANSVVLGAGLTLDAVVFSRTGNDLLVSVKNSTDRLTVKDWFAAGSHFTDITLGDGVTLDHAGVEAAMPKNQAPVATQDMATVVEDGATYVSGNALSNDSDPEGRTLRVTNAGTYAGAVGTLTLGGNGAYSYTLANGSQSVQNLAAGQTLTETFAYTVTDDDPNGAATANSSIRITVQGTNDLPTLGADSAATSEDAGPIGGNVLANDYDIDAGTTLSVSNAGMRAGTYGSLTLGSDGVWSYSLDNASGVVQSLASGQTVTDSFGVGVSDGIAQVGSSLSIHIAGQNDAPILAAPLADQSSSANSSWNWQLPVGSFADVDAGDMLGYTATLADGTALPSWLAFDAATQTFSGRVPKSATGSIDIRVAATDRAGALASDIFTLSFAAGTGGGGRGGSNNGGGGQGNEGVGNGVDGMPQGHAADFNDGAGTSPGDPGAQGGNGYVPLKRADLQMQDVHIEGRRITEAASGNERGNSADAQAAAPGLVKQADDALIAFNADGVPTGGNDTTGNGNDRDATTPDDASNGQPAVPKWLQEAAWAYLDSRGSDAGYLASGNGGDAVAAFMQWLAVQQAIAEQGRHGLPDWLDASKGADLRSMLLTDGRFLGSDRPAGSDPLGLHAAASLQTFVGLGNGVQNIL